MSRRFVAAATCALALGACGGSDAPAASQPEAARGGDGLERRGGLRQAAVPDVGHGPDDGMEVEGLRGHLTPYQIQMGIRPHQRALSNCYARHAEHEYIGGRIIFGFDVDREGTVISPRIASSALGAWDVEACLLDVVRQMTFDPPDGGVATVTMPLDFDGRGAVGTWHEERAARELSAPPGEAPAADEEEARERRRQAKRQQRASRSPRSDENGDEPETKREDLEQCAEESGVEPPAGLRITVYIDRRGRVTSAGFSADGEIGEAWAACATARVTAWTMSAPETPGVTVAKLEFPFPLSRRE